MAGRQKEKATADEVHQNQILRELYLKELRTQKLYTQYHVNPLRKVHTIARKPMSWHDNLEEPADGSTTRLDHDQIVVSPGALAIVSGLQEVAVGVCSTQKLYQEVAVGVCSTQKLYQSSRFLNLIHHAAQGPRKKYPETQTEGQEIGWDSEPLVNPQREDHRLNHFRVYNDITLYKAKMWSLGEDDRHK